jgi:hypothetical protein
MKKWKALEKVVWYTVTVIRARREGSSSIPMPFVEVVRSFLRNHRAFGGVRRASAVGNTAVANSVRQRGVRVGWSQSFANLREAIREPRDARQGRQREDGRPYTMGAPG